MQVPAFLAPEHITGASDPAQCTLVLSSVQFEETLDEETKIPALWPFLVTESLTSRWGPDLVSGVPPVEVLLLGSQVMLDPSQHSLCPEGIMKIILASRAWHKLWLALSLSTSSCLHADEKQTWLRLLKKPANHSTTSTISLVLSRGQVDILAPWQTRRRPILRNVSLTNPFRKSTQPGGKRRSHPPKGSPQSFLHSYFLLRTKGGGAVGLGLEGLRKAVKNHGCFSLVNQFLMNILLAHA